MQQTSAMYQALIADPGARKEVRVTVAGVLYEQGQILSLSTSACLFAEDTMSVGGAIAKEINLALVNPGTIPRMAEIIPSYRLVKGSQASEWIQKGIYYIDTRSTDELTGVLGLLYQKKEEPVPEEILKLAEERAAARREKDWARADALRDAIAARGYLIEETRQGSRITKK